MASGKLASAVLSALDYNTVYTVPSVASSAIVNVLICNLGVAAATVKIAVTTDTVPANADYVECDITIEPSSGNFIKTGLFLSPAEKIIVWSSNDNVSVRVNGIEDI